MGDSMILLTASIRNMAYQCSLGDQVKEGYGTRQKECRYTRMHMGGQNSLEVVVR
jgi:hypothetical protein